MTLLTFLLYIFVIRLARRSLELDLNPIIKSIEENILSLSFQLQAVIIIYLIIFGCFFICASRYYYIYIKRTALTLFLYYEQYEMFRDIGDKIISSWQSLRLYAINKVIRATWNWDRKNAHPLIRITTLIWPNTFDIIERNLFMGLVPYLLYYDYQIHDRVLTKVFVILPWLFLYSLLRILLRFIRESKGVNGDMRNFLFTMNTYGFKNSKIKHKI